MKFAKFLIKNFKGIEEITFDLEKSPEANIFTLVGLNESGKTTILEAINQFSIEDNNSNSLDAEDAKVKDKSTFIPISKRDNFNDEISISATLRVDDQDWKKINDFASTDTDFQKIKQVDYLSYHRHYKYQDSNYVEVNRTWSGLSGVHKEGTDDKTIRIDHSIYPKDNSALVSFCRRLIPSILYFPNFLFDFPSRIYLETNDAPSTKEEFYINLIQDILNSLENETTVEKHIINRIVSTDQNQKKNLDRLIQKMELKVTEVIFEAWDRIFKRKITDTRIKIEYNVDGENLSFLQFGIEAKDGIYELNERSLGFKWFFIFFVIYSI